MKSKNGYIALSGTGVGISINNDGINFGTGEARCKLREKAILASRERASSMPLRLTTSSAVQLMRSMG